VDCYWNSHPHLLQLIEPVNGQPMGAEMSLSFCLSLLSFINGWLGHTGFAELPVTPNGDVLNKGGLPYRLLTRNLLQSGGPAPSGRGRRSGSLENHFQAALPARGAPLPGESLDHDRILKIGHADSTDPRSAD
jgi:hypothetical protein